MCMSISEFTWKYQIGNPIFIFLIPVGQSSVNSVSDKKKIRNPAASDIK
jgi:hypothetical protein